MGNVGSRRKNVSKSHNAAVIARIAAGDQNSERFRSLSAKMCWDAAIECQVLAGMDRPASVTIDEHEHVISIDDERVTSALEMTQVPEGASIGFFRGERLIHFMISVGGGDAAGNKNECIGVGKPVGFEVLDLAGSLSWGEQGFKDGGGRTVFIRFREMG